MIAFPELQNVVKRPLIFVEGKGGVGKTVISRALARCLADQGQSVLWATFEDPTRPAGELRMISPRLWELNAEAGLAFEEFAAIKLGGAKLSRIFTQNKLIRYLAQAAPGIHELVLLGKIWFETSHYDHVVVDMPSTGHGLAMFQSVENFSQLFKGGPLSADAVKMLQTFQDPEQTGQLIVALPEEMPLQESLELSDLLMRLFPENPPAFLVNRCFPQVASPDPGAPDGWPTPVARSTEEYAAKRSALEKFNLGVWDERKLPYSRLDFVPPGTEGEKFLSEVKVRLAAAIASGDTR